MERRPEVGGVAHLKVREELRRSSSVGPVMGGRQIKQRLKNEGDGENDYGMKRTL
jgi:hypothetical protein